MLYRSEAKFVPGTGSQVYCCHPKFFGVVAVGIVVAFRGYEHFIYYELFLVDVWTVVFTAVFGIMFTFT